MPTNFQQILEFNKSFDVFINPLLETKNPNLDLYQNTIINKKLKDLKCDLIIEEIGELEESIEQSDFIEFIDALSDILYVTYGAGVSFGIDCDQEYTKFLQNMNESESKIDCGTNYIKSLDFLNNNSNGIYSLFETPYSKHLFIYLNQSRIELKKIRDLPNDCFSTHKCINLFRDVLNKVLHFTYILGIVYRINLDETFEIVHRSNMSKLAQNEDLAKKTVNWYRENELRYDSPSYKISPDNKSYIIFNKSSNKVLKSIKYTPANFTNLGFSVNDWQFRNI